MADTKPVPFYRWLLVAIPCPIGFFVLCYWLLPSTKPAGTLAGMLVGDRVLILEFPARPDAVERIEVNRDKTAARGLFPIHDPRAVTIMTLPNDLGVELDTLRTAWCDKTPIFSIPPGETEVYELAIKCRGIVNPDIRIPVHQLPPALTALIATVPPAPPEKK